MKRLTTLFALTSLVLALGQLPSANAQTNTTAPAPVPTQVVILGTLHGTHEANTNYSLEVLRKLIVAMKPAAILVEQPPENGGQPTVRNGRATELRSLENVVANLAADDLEVNVIPYDKEGRDEFYQQTRYFPRQQAANERLNKWLAAQKRNAPGSIPILADRLETEAEESQNRLTHNSGPEIINSPVHDMVIVTKHGLAFGVIPKLLAAAGERELAEEFFFVNDEWQERNQIMARKIRENACKFAGKRLVVLAGAEHRYILRELLAKAPEVELKEFYEVPEWTGATPPTFAGSARKNGSATSPSVGQQSGAPGDTLVGVGFLMESGYPNIKRLFPGSPAEASGQLHPGDRVIAVAQGNHAFVDVRSLSMQELVQTTRGKPGTTVRLQVLPADAAPGSTPKTVTLTRAQFKIN